MDIPEHIFKSYDIRGIYPQEINEENIVPITRAIYLFFAQKIGVERPLQIVLSYDMRLSGQALYGAVKKTLIDAGAHVIDTGRVSTPTFYFTVSHYGYDCGIQVTASHNPKEYNGMKIVVNSPNGLIKIGKSTGMDEIKKMSQSRALLHPRFEGQIKQKTNVLEDEVENALSIFHHPSIKKFKIVADPANAMGAQYIEALFQRVSAELVRMNFTLDGNFPVHPPDPLNFENLVSLQKRVIEEKADLGLAPDGDGDRLYFVDEKGQVIPATIITCLVTRELLRENPGAKVLFDIRYILGASKIVEEFRGKYEISRVGHAFITERMGKSGAIFAGESSGHFYFRATGNAESPLATLIAVLKVLSAENKPFSEVVADVRRSFESGEVNFRVNNAEEILSRLKEKYSEGQLSTLDGIAITYPDWRFSVRTSNTEPLLRLNLEGYSQEVVSQKKDEVIHVIKSLAK